MQGGLLSQFEKFIAKRLTEGSIHNFRSPKTSTTNKKSLNLQTKLIKLARLKNHKPQLPITQVKQEKRVDIKRKWQLFPTSFLWAL